MDLRLFLSSRARDILRNSGRPRRVVKQVEHMMLEILQAQRPRVTFKP